MLGHETFPAWTACEKRPKASGRHTPAKACTVPSSLIRTIWRLSPASNRRLRILTGSADLPAGPEALAGSYRWPLALGTYRRWGVSPRPEDVVVVLPANRPGKSTTFPGDALRKIVHLAEQSVWPATHADSRANELPCQAPIVPQHLIHHPARARSAFRRGWAGAGLTGQLGHDGFYQRLLDMQRIV